MMVPDWLERALACPACRESLAVSPAALTCTTCGRTFPQTDDDSVNLMHRPATADAAWASRQRWMEQEYDTLLNDGNHPSVAFENDYGHLARLLTSYRGLVADVGGGAGVTRHWLPADSDYVLIEPSRMWRDPRWRRHAASFPCLARPTVLVRAFAEALPLASGRFDAVLLLWSLNHVCDAAQSLREARRVLRHGGRMLVVLEDMQPSWGDLWSGAYPGASVSRSLRLAAARIGMTPVALQPDHITVDERMMTSVRSMRLLQRAWIGNYLLVELESA